MRLRVTLLLSVALLLIAGTAFGQSAAKKPVVLWGFSQTDLEPIQKLYQASHPDVEVRLVIKSAGDYPNLLKQILQGGQTADSPDVFVLDIVYAKLFTESNWAADLSSLQGAATSAGMFPYVQDIGKDSKGRLKALSWQSTVGGFYYRRSLAKQYLGSDDPQKVYEAVKDLSAFRATAEKLRQKSGGSVSLISSRNELQFALLYSRQNAWIKDGALVLDPNVNTLLDISKEFYDNKYEARIPALYTTDWYSTMRDAYKLDGQTQYVLGYLLPAWALSNHFIPNAKSADGSGKSTIGDWALTQGPVDYIRGGSWLAVNASSPNKAEALKFVQTVTTDLDFMVAMAKEKGDFTSSEKVNAKLGSGYKSEFLGGQNPFEIFNALAKKVKASSLVSPYDKEINALFAEQLAQYSTGKKDKAKAIADFKAGVSNQFGDIIEVK